jgi:hypothetical protein
MVYVFVNCRTAMIGPDEVVSAMVRISAARRLRLAD